MRDYAFGNYLYELRRKTGLSQTELARQLGVTNKAVSKGEIGSAKPGTDTLRKLAGLFGVTVDALSNEQKGR